jgi:hypothetical protein
VTDITAIFSEVFAMLAGSFGKPGDLHGSYSRVGVRGLVPVFDQAKAFLAVGVDLHP